MILKVLLFGTVNVRLIIIITNCSKIHIFTVLNETKMEDFKSIDLASWVKVGEGGNGSTYEDPARPEVILKVNKPRVNTLETISHEYEVSKAVGDLGLPTPRMIEMVRVGSGYGIVSERIVHKKSLSRICHDEPGRTEEMARVLCDEGKKLFATQCPVDLFPSRKEQLLGALDKASFVSKKDMELIRAFVDTIPDSGTCVHGDFQTGNLIYSQGKYYWIDLDRFGHGDPMFDIGHLFLLCHYYASLKQVQDIFHMTFDQFQRFWDAFAKAYTGKDDHSGFDVQAGKFAALDMIVRIHFEAPTFAEKIFFGIYVKKMVKAYYRQ